MSTPIQITGLTVAEDPDLAADGWVRRTVGDPQRAEEHRQVYNEIGFEVMLRPLDDSSFAEECTGCSGTGAVVLYTRKMSEI